MNEKIKEIFYIFTKNLFGHPIELSDIDLERFLKNISKQFDIKSLDDWFFWYFFTYQFCYWSTKKTRFGGNVQVNWIVGPKAIERWLKKPDEWFYFCEEFLKRKRISRLITTSGNKYKTGEVNEIDRRRFFNHEDGFRLCSELSLYKTNSISCIVCKFKKICQIQELAPALPVEKRR